jgi:hypothetical protein
MPEPATKEALQHLLQQAQNRGLLVEAGWLATYLAIVPKNLSKARIAELRAVFFAGAAHLFEVFVRPSKTDVQQVAMIQSELQEHARRRRAPPHKSKPPTHPKPRSR